MSMQTLLNPPAEPLHPLPARGAVAREALRAVGHSVRLEIGAVLVLLLGLLVMMATVTARGPGGADYDVADMTWPVVMLGLFAPLAVWKHEEPARRAYLWSMPVDRFRHVLIRVWSGWAWLMAVVATYIVWAIGVALVTGGHVVINPDWEMVMLRERAPGVPIRDLTLAGHPWLWLTPFAAATTMYLAGTTVALLFNYPLRVFAGTWFALMVLMAVPDALGGGMDRTVEMMLERLANGRYGFLTHATGIIHLFDRPRDMVVNVYDHTDPVAWVLATLLWMAVPLAGAVLAARRYQER
jgi:hypothetical protein